MARKTNPGCPEGGDAHDGCDEMTDRVRILFKMRGFADEQALAAARDRLSRSSTDRASAVSPVNELNRRIGVMLSEERPRRLSGLLTATKADEPSGPGLWQAP